MIIPDPIQFIATVQFRAVEALIQQCAAEAQKEGS